MINVFTVKFVLCSGIENCYSITLTDKECMVLNDRSEYETIKKIDFLCQNRWDYKSERAIMYINGIRYFNRQLHLTLNSSCTIRDEAPL